MSSKRKSAPTRILEEDVPVSPKGASPAAAATSVGAENEGHDAKDASPIDLAHFEYMRLMVQQRRSMEDVLKRLAASKEDEEEQNNPKLRDFMACILQMIKQNSNKVGLFPFHP